MKYSPHSIGLRGGEAQMRTDIPRDRIRRLSPLKTLSIRPLLHRARRDISISQGAGKLV